MDPCVELEFAGGGDAPVSATLRLNRPDARNALNVAMGRALLAAAAALAAREDVACCVLAASGPVFCAGADLKERRTMDDDAIRARRLLAFRAYDAIERLPMPVFAAVDGPCIGSGCEIATACDFIVASERSFFQYPETQWGTVGATQRLPRIVGPRMAKELLFTGRRVDAREAQALGIVNAVVAPEAFAARVEELRAQILKAPLAALRQAKRTVDRGVADTRAGALAHEILAIEENLERADWKALMGGTAGSV